MRALNRIFKGRGRDAQPLTLPKKVARLLKQKNAALHLPGEQTPVLGPELFSFANVNGGLLVTAADGGYKFNGSGQIAGDAGQRSYVNFSTVIDKTYRFSFKINNDNLVYPGSGWFICAGSNGTGTILSLRSPNAAKTYEVDVKATSTTTSILFDSNLDYSVYTVSNISVREILSYNDTINGFKTGNYTDSVGTTPAVIDGKTGLVVDAAGSVGTELVTGDGATFDNGVGNWITFGSPSFSAVGGVAQITNVANYADRAQLNIAAAANRTVLLEFDAWVSSGTGRYEFKDLVSPYTSRILFSVTNTSRQRFSARVQIPAGGASLQVVPYSGNASQILYFDNISVRELTGINALQATDGFKPLSRRGLVNQLLWSNDFSNAVWNKLNLTPTSGELDQDGGYTATKLSSSFSLDYWAIYNNTTVSWLVGEIQYAQSAEWTLKVETFTVPVGCTSIRVYPRRSTAGSAYAYESVTVTPSATYTVAWWHRTSGSNYYQSPIGLFQGTVTRAGPGNSDSWISDSLAQPQAA